MVSKSIGCKIKSADCGRKVCNEGGSNMKKDKGAWMENFSANGHSWERAKETFDRPAYGKMGER